MVAVPESVAGSNLYYQMATNIKYTQYNCTYYYPEKEMKRT